MTFKDIQFEEMSAVYGPDAKKDEAKFEKVGA
jgi:hypothetical protein